ncbi:MAG: hypothetical protein DWI22_11160 [Planctomycetota bacterium]|nr:MAG: hypothetical protein DWI22_11160 [Planctomycetota bacterium]
MRALKTIDENELRQNEGFLEMILVTVMIFGVVLLFGFVIVNPREEIVVLRFGKFLTTSVRYILSRVFAIIRVLLSGES